ncbi:hypothetical protein Hanom_Chr14g01318051 [Helianthus anomalus]
MDFCDDSVEFQGCDVSILIDNGPISEKLAPAHQGLQGFDDPISEKVAPAHQGLQGFDVRGCKSSFGVCVPWCSFLC